MFCAGCDQRIALDVRHCVVGIQTFHPSCAARHRQRSVPAVSSAAAPAAIGVLEGIALVFNEPCGILRANAGTAFESFEPTASDSSIRAGGQELRVDHRPGGLNGRFLQLANDGGYLTFRFELRDGIRERDALAKARRGDFRGCSIGFRPRVGGSQFRGTVEHFLEGQQLDEISVLTERGPAWFGTHVRASRLT
ncbi:MAG: HK97 family phage prohead protease [Vicinamibacterales bacterium]